MFRTNQSKRRVARSMAMDESPEVAATQRYQTSMAACKKKEKGETSFDLFGGVSEEMTINKNVSLLDEKLLDMSL